MCIGYDHLCLCVCLSLATFPHYCTDPNVTWGNGRRCRLVVHYWAVLQSVHGFRCYDNIALNTKCQRVLVLAFCLVTFGVRCSQYFFESWIPFLLPSWQSDKALKGRKINTEQNSAQRLCCLLGNRKVFGSFTDTSQRFPSGIVCGSLLILTMENMLASESQECED